MIHLNYFFLQVEKPVLVYHDEEYKCKRWNFPSYNFSLSVIWSPFLVEAAIFEDINGVSSSEVELHLDRLDSKWTDQYLDFDYIIISFQESIGPGKHQCRQSF